jgi:hypothetical protein
MMGIWCSWQSLDDFLVHGLVAVVGQDTDKGLTLVQSLGGLVKGASETVVDEGGLQGGVDVHRTGDGHGFISFDVGQGPPDRNSGFCTILELKKNQQKIMMDENELLIKY